MDGERFDAIAKVLGLDISRRAVALSLTILTTGGFSLFAESEAKKKRKKKTICHNGQTIKVKKKALKAHLAHGDTRGACSASNSPVDCRRTIHETCNPSVDSPDCCRDGLECAVSQCDNENTICCLDNIGDECLDECDCCSPLGCSEREGFTCRTCSIAQGPCENEADCCRLDSICGGRDPGKCCINELRAPCNNFLDCCAAIGVCDSNGSGELVCCRLAGGECSEDLDCCNGLFCNSGGQCEQE